jgi:hypothetical protein
MEMKPATIETFDAASGKGILRLDEDDGEIPVHFASNACRGVVPKVGGRVRAGNLEPEPGTGGPLSDTFALRAAIVEADTGNGDVVTVHTVGLREARPGTDWSGKPILRVPFDDAAFPTLATAFREKVVGMLAFGRATPVEPTKLPKHLKGLSRLFAVSRCALRYRLARGEVVDGSTFAGGDCADIGDVAWPTGIAGPMLPVLQIGVEDARKIGLKHQINVFVDSAPPAEASLPSLLPAFIHQQVAGERGNVHVVACKPGRRRTGPGAVGKARSLSLIDERPVFPDIIGLQTAYAALGEALPVDVQRFWEVQIASKAKKDEFRSIAEEIAKHFPTVDDLDADVVLGGFSALQVQGRKPLRRLATFSTTKFDWLGAFAEDWPKAALEVSFDGGSPPAWMHGS